MELLQAEEAPALLCPSLMLEKPHNQSVAGGAPSGKGQGRSFDSKGQDFISPELQAVFVMSRCWVGL